MAFEKTIQLKNCRYDYTLSPSVKKFTLKDNTFFETKVGNYELTRLLEKVPNSGEGFQLKIIINKELTGAKINITDKFGLRLDLAGISISTGSACTAGIVQSSHVLEAMYGANSDRLKQSVRISLSPQNTVEDLQTLAKTLKEIIGG